jgi:hypothetical protein
MIILKTHKIKLKTKRIFLTKGTCSHTFFYILNREFGYPKPDEEQAIDPLAGGIVQQGYQCGMLWGASLALGAETFRRYKDINKATVVAIQATQHVIKSFEKQTKCIECEDFTKTDFKNKWGIAKFLFSGKFLSCFKLAEKWAPEAIKAAHEGLELDQTQSTQKAISCASEVIRKMGGSDEEKVMVAGFAGGLGLCGSGCGALAAAIWKTILDLVKDNSWKPTFPDPVSENIINKFYQSTNYKMSCYEICGRRFKSTKDHTEFIRNGGCDKLINVLAQS